MARRSQLAARREGTRIALQFPFDRGLQATLKQRLRARWDPDSKHWWIPAPSGRAAQAAAGVLSGLGFAGVDEAIGICELGSVQITPDVFSDIAKSRNASDLPTVMLRPYQVEGARMLADARRVLLADQPGLGKTFQSIGAVLAEHALPTLVVCPASVRTNWALEIASVAPWAKVVSLMTAPQEEVLADFVIVSWAGLSRHRDKFPEFKSIVADECHYAKDVRTKRSKALRAAARAVPYDGMVIALSGTPVVNCHADLLPILETLGVVHLFGNREKFLDRYCDPTVIRVPDKPGPEGDLHWRDETVYRGSKHGLEMRTILTEAGVMLRRRKDDVLDDLPPKQIGVQVVDLDRSWEALLEAAHSGARNASPQTVAASERLPEQDEELSSALIAVAVDKDLPGPREVLQRRLRAMPGNLPAIAIARRLAAVAKIPVACEWISSWLTAAEDEKLVVFARHREVTTTLADRFGVDPVIGGVTHRKRQAVLDDFASEDGNRLLVASYEALGVGVNLQAANNMLIIEQPWTPAQCEQAEDRCHRFGQEKPVTITYLVASGTIDEPVWAALDRKSAVVGEALDGIGEPAQMPFETVVSWLDSRDRGRIDGHTSEPERQERSA